MVSAANLLLDAAAAQGPATTAGLGQAAQDQDPSSSPFLAIVQDLMGSTEQATSETVRAGQEAAVDEQPVDGEEPESSDAVDIGYLLGSVQIVCSEVQALPNQVVTDVPVTQEVAPTAIENSTIQVAPNAAQPMAEQSAEGSAQVAQTEESVPELVGRTDVPTQGVSTTDDSAQMDAGRPTQTVQAAQAAATPAEVRPSESQTRPAREDGSVSGVATRENAERPELPEYLRNIIPQDGSRFADRVVLSRESRGVQPTVDADPELAMAPVDRPEQGDLATDLPNADQGVQWTPIETRPTVDTTVRTVAATTPGQPIDQVERTNIIHQIVRTAKVHAFEGGGEMVMRLEPAHLGSIQMSVTADNGVVTAHLRAGTESVRQVLESEIVMLRQSLSDSGIRVDSISVSVGDNLGQGGNWHAGTQNGSQYTGNQQNGYATARSFGGGSDAASVDEPSAAYTGAGFNYLA